MTEAKLKRALSIRQPYAEQILRRTKKIEYRSQPTKIRERVYIYASQTLGAIEDFEEMNLQPGELPTGMLVGTVEISDCTGYPGLSITHKLGAFIDNHIPGGSQILESLPSPPDNRDARFAV